MFEKITLENGIRIVYEHLPHLRSATFGIWVVSGGSHEPEELSGISHFIEHMAFKGTAKRRAADIAQEFDAMGGQVNAFTSKEVTCYYAKTLDTHVLQGFDILCDMVQNSLFAEADMENERNVILEEIAMYEDTPEDLVVEELIGGIWRGHPLGRSVLGSTRTVKAITGDRMRGYAKENYLPGNIVISISGAFDAEAFFAAAAKAFALAEREAVCREVEACRYHPALVLKRKNIEQNHICIGFEGVSSGDGRRYGMSLLNTVFGGGMSSRLFRRVREDAGLAYSVSSFSVTHKAGGIIVVYLAVNQRSEQEALSLVREETEKLRREGITEEEFMRAKEQLKSGLILDFESTSARMKFMAANELNKNGIADIDDMIRQVDKITREDTSRLAEQFFDFEKASLSVVGKPKKRESYEEFLKG